MKKTVLIIDSHFYTESPFAKNTIRELEDDSYGLVFNEFLHAMGVLLEVDILYEQLSPTQWLHANNRHIQIILDKEENRSELFQIIPKTSKGELLISKMTAELLNENREFLSIS